MNNIKWWHRIKLSNGRYTPGKVHYGPDGGDWPTTRFGIPEQLTGKTVLDIGAWDGFFSFEAECRGARVLAMDCCMERGGNDLGTDGFFYARGDLNSNVDFVNASIEDTGLVERIGTFDIVFFFGVLYHLQNPEIGLQNACDLAKDTLIVESAINSKTSESVLVFDPNKENDPTNFYYPNKEWITEVAEDKGFKLIETRWTDGIRATYIFRRQ